MGGKENDIIYTTGRLTKIAIASGYFTYEDSSLVTDRLCEDMTSKITMKKDIVLGANSNVDYLVKLGTKVKTGDPLVIFENSFDDGSINDLLSKLGDEFDEVVKDMNKNKLKSKYTGEIVGINIYYNKDIPEFSPSIQNILKDYIKKGRAKKDNLKEHIGSLKNLNNINFKSVDKQTSNKIKGQDVDGILIEIFIEYMDKLSIGDKITFYTSLKTIVSDVIPNGEEPFSSNEPNEPIDAILSPLSITSRMTSDIYNAMYTNKALLGLKKCIKKIMDK